MIKEAGLTVLPLAAIAWAMFKLGRLWERDYPSTQVTDSRQGYPRVRSGQTFTVVWDPSDIQYPDGSTIRARRGVYDQENES